jgi:hypothetical protein
MNSENSNLNTQNTVGTSQPTGSLQPAGSVQPGLQVTREEVEGFIDLVRQLAGKGCSRCGKKKNKCNRKPKCKTCNRPNNNSPLDETLRTVTSTVANTVTVTQPAVTVTVPAPAVNKTQAPCPTCTPYIDTDNELSCNGPSCTRPSQTSAAPCPTSNQGNAFAGTAQPGGTVQPGSGTTQP